MEIQCLKRVRIKDEEIEAEHLGLDQKHVEANGIDIPSGCRASTDSRSVVRNPCPTNGIAPPNTVSPANVSSG